MTDEEPTVEEPTNVEPTDAEERYTPIYASESIILELTKFIGNTPSNDLLDTVMENVVLMKRENAKLIALNMIIIGKCLSSHTEI